MSRGVQIGTRRFGQGTRKLCYSRSIGDPSGLAELKELRTVELDDPRLTDLRVFAGAQRLEALVLSGTGVSDLTPLWSLPGLRVLELSIRRTAVTDLSPLASARSLRILRMDDTPVTDLYPLHDPPCLQQVVLTGTRASAQQVAALRRARPDTVYNVPPEFR